MADTIDARPTQLWRRRAIATWVSLAVLLLLAAIVLFGMAATDDTDNIALSRNQIIQASSGTRTWRGTFWNHSDSRYSSLDAVILFLDKDGQPVGQARGGADRLEPGEVFHMQAPLAATAVRMRVYQLRWTGPNGGRAVLGPYRVWPFGFVMDTACGDLRTKLGSCKEQQERK